MFPFAIRTAVSVLALTVPMAALHAAEVAATADVASDGDDTPIVVKGQRESYGAATTATATKTNTAIRNIPQALTIISRAQIDDQQLRSVGELLNFVPGASPATGESNRDQMTLRGNNTTADFFVNGLRDDVQYFRDFYNVERVEVLKGPNAMIFGRGGGGGVVNRVTKRTRFDARRGASIGTTSFGGLRASADLDQPLGGTMSARVNGLYEKGESFRRHVDLERYGINPTIGFAVGPETRIDLAYEYFHDRRTADRGLPSDQRSGPASRADPAHPLKGFDRTFFGDPDKSFAKADVHLASLAVEHRLAEGLTLRNRSLVGAYDKAYQNVYPNGPVTDRDGAGPQGHTVRLAAYRDLTKRDNLFSQTDLVWDSKTGGIDQTLLAGFEIGRSSGFNQRLNGVFGPDGVGPSSRDVQVAAPTVDLPAVSFLANGANNDIRTRVAALYVQDQLRPARWLEIVAGLRFDRFAVKVENNASGAGTGRVDHLWSPRLGVILKPASNVSLYAGYSRSYLPQAGDQFNSLAANLQTLKPERFDNVEIGAKWEPFEGLLATAALYQLDRKNTRAVDPADPTRIVLTGAQRSRGLELGLERSITDRWQISAGYAWQDAAITETTTAAPKGRKVPLVPRHSFSAWTRYDVTPAIGIGGGVIARSKSYTSLSNTVILPGYARVDAAAYYTVARGVEAQLNVENLFGAHYFPAAHNDNNIAPGAPRSAKVTLNFGL